MTPHTLSVCMIATFVNVTCQNCDWIFRQYSYPHFLSSLNHYVINISV